MSEFIITLLFGWLGAHKFMQKKYVLGIVYLFTMGLFGIGWMIDVVLALIKMVNGGQQEATVQEPNTSSLVYKPSDNSLTERKYTHSQIEGMKKADILEMASGLGYIMTTIESNTKDKIIAEFMEHQQSRPSTEKRKWLIKSFNTEIVGTFAKCDLDKDYERADIICSLKPNSKLDLEYWEYKGEPAFYVCNKGLDAGCVPATISKKLHEIYSDCEIVVSLRGESEYNTADDLIQKICINVYK